MIRKLTVEPVTIRGVDGFMIQGMWRACSDSFWEHISHDAFFASRKRAEAMLARMGTKPGWEYDWSHWGVPIDRGLSNLDYVQQHVAAYSPLPRR